jgi:hypothetical protein
MTTNSHTPRRARVEVFATAAALIMAIPFVAADSRPEPSTAAQHVTTVTLDEGPPTNMEPDPPGPGG